MKRHRLTNKNRPPEPHSGGLLLSPHEQHANGAVDQDCLGVIGELEQDDQAGNKELEFEHDNLPFYGYNGIILLIAAGFRPVIAPPSLRCNGGVNFSYFWRKTQIVRYNTM